jgi:RNA 2',3'-cyclic 3'-phosphodiesterase
LAPIRTFIAVEMPVDISTFAKERQQALKKADINMKWVRSGNIHLTLQFLGDVEAEEIPVVQASMKNAVKGASTFTLKAKGLGVFPNLKRPKALWVGLVGQIDLLKDLNRRISEALAAIGFPKEKRNFKGHLTVGRVKGKIDSLKLDQAISAQKDFETSSFRVDSVCLFKSRLTPQGAIYTKLAEASLKVSN